jgi:hypothetical protein
LVPGEERLALFPARFVDGEKQPRRMFIGTVPVGRRESYQAATVTPVAGSPPTHTEDDPRLTLFKTQVLAAWRGLIPGVMGTGEPIGSLTDPDDAEALKKVRLPRVFASDDKSPPAPVMTQPDLSVLRDERSRLQVASWFLLLDLMKFLRDQLPDFWIASIVGTATPAVDDPARALYDALDQAAMPPDLVGSGVTLAGSDPVNQSSLADQFPDYAVETGLIAAMRGVAADGLDAFEKLLEAAPNPLTLPLASDPPTQARPTPTSPVAGWPTTLFLFADPWFGVLHPPLPDDLKPIPTDYLSEFIAAVIDSIADPMRVALAAVPLPAQPVAAAPLASRVPADLSEAWYRIRFVYERPDCQPFESTVVSRPTDTFQMAGFFDPDAPARPIRIGLPLDISPAGLRKFDRNTAFMMSDMLCGHIDRFKGMSLADLVLSVLPFPFHKSLSVPDKGPCKQAGGDPLGVMCSLSIPIITICALILLMIIVSLLDMIFAWLPYFVVCFPVPGFKGKKDA